MSVVGELNRALRSPTPPSGQLLAGIVLRLIEEAAVSRPGLAARFIVSRNQIIYRSADRRYVVLIVQGDGEKVRVIWQVSVRNAGTSFISYEVNGQVWSVVDWKVSDQSLENLELLAKAGGEVLGFLEQIKLLPPTSPFQRALEAQVIHTASMRPRRSSEAEASKEKAREAREAGEAGEAG